MKEDFLHFIWKFQYFDAQNLRTTTHETLQIIHQGMLNNNAGADFSEAHIKIGEVAFSGDVEIHLKASDWLKHQHSENEQYNKVVLHVVWENDTEIKRPDNTIIPVLELKERVKTSIIGKYKMLEASQDALPCGNLLKNVAEIHTLMMLDQATVRRLERKTTDILDIFKTHQDWEDTTYQCLARNFGFKINAEGFLSLAQSLPLKYLQKHRDSIFQIEALIFGQAGFLEKTFEDEYPKKLQQEYSFLAKKYQLKPINAAKWNFLRLRPANFPTLRLAQFAQMIQKNINLFSVFLYAEQYKTLLKIFDSEVSEYWKTHYTFEKTLEKGKTTASKFGKASAENIVINTVVPLLVFYSQQTRKQEFTEKAISFLEAIKPEKNHITAIWEGLGIKIKSAFDSQAVIEQYNTFCTQKKCLQCSIGANILQNI